MTAKRCLNYYSQRSGSGVNPNPKLCNTLFEADYIGVSGIPMNKRFKPLYYAGGFESRGSVYFPIGEIVKEWGFDIFRHVPGRAMYAEMRFPANFVVLDDGERFIHVGFNAFAVSLVRKGYRVAGIGTMIHGNDDIGESMRVPERIDMDEDVWNRYCVFTTINKPIGFMDPAYPYLSAKRIFDDRISAFIEEAFRA